MIAGFHTPEWVKDSIFYQIFPDRFAKSDRLSKSGRLQAWDAPPTPYGYKGGDLLGVVEHLDYLQDLGITAIYLNPIFQSASNHRYHTHDYYHVDPLLGGNRAFHTLLDESHRRGIRIVLDGVFNHASRGFFQFNDILENGPDSPYLDWFHIQGYPLNAYWGKPNYRCWAGLAALPKFNTGNPQVRNFIFDVARYWIEQGIDGWRLDVPFEIDDDSFWQEFRQVVRRANPEAYLVGEISREAQRWLLGDQFDAVMNYQFTQACLGFFAGDRINRSLEAGMMGLPPSRVLDAQAFAARAQALLDLYPREAALAQFNLLDSHDMPRFLTLAGGDQAALRLATLFQMTYPGAPCVYYGDEIGLQGGRDPDNRRAMPWGASPSLWDGDLRMFFRDCIALRKAHPVLRRGDFIPIYAEGQVIVYERKLGAETLIVALNNSEERFALLPILGEHRLLENGWQALSSDQASLKPGSLFALTLAPRTGVVLIPKEI